MAAQLLQGSASPRPGPPQRRNAIWPEFTGLHRGSVGDADPGGYLDCGGVPIVPSLANVSILRAEQLSKTFAAAAGSPPAASGDAAAVMAVRGVDLSVQSGEFVAITGPSGCGKSTLLHLLGGITRPSSGRVMLEDVDLAGLDDDALAAIRRRRIGFVFQRYNLLPELSLLENVALPLVLDGMGDAQSDAAAREALEAVGMSPRAAHRPDELSGGEQQRGAIARALVCRPAIVLADEPTGALDSGNSQRVMDLLARLVEDRGQTVVLVTHDPAVAAVAARTIRMRDGRVQFDSAAESGAALRLPHPATRT